MRKPGSKIIDEILECEDQAFVNFVEVINLSILILIYRDALIGILRLE
jgi:hypothetical protein